MLKPFRLRTALATLVSTSIASSLLFLPLLSTQRIDRNATSVIEAQTNPLADNNIDEAEKLLGITLLGAGAAGIIWGVSRKNKQSLPNSSHLDNALSIDRASPQLRQKLLRLMHNDRAGANRLLTGAKLNNPNRSINWLAEKVIYDLERDRGRI
ncbi:MAG: hypothetical protein MUD14_00810 [Hydrococcus sp. Prado102]|jgi:hypothetical protein|nr:hypothetical protein [Hydrococcus sp. Prado102]